MQAFFDIKSHHIKSVLLAFFGCWALQILSGISVRNPLTIVFFALLFWFAFLRFSLDMRTSIMDGAISVAVSLVLTYVLRNKISFEFNNALFRFLGIAITFIGISSLVYVLVALVRVIVSPDRVRILTGLKSIVIEKDDAAPYTSIKAFLIMSLICFLCWFPYFLYEFPGIMTADSLVQYEQIIGIEPYSNHHPVLHTLMIKFFYDIGYGISGDPKVGIACYTLFQMIFMALCFSFLTIHLDRKRSQIRALIFFAIIPYNAIFAVTIWKDIPFAGVTMLLFCVVKDLRENIADDCGKKTSGSVRIMLQWAFFTVLSILFALLRSNAWIAFILWIPFLLVAFKKDFMKISYSIVTVVISVALVKGPVFSSLGVVGPDFVESLSVPSQQIARMYINDVISDDEDISLIQSAIDTTYIKDLYVADYADNIKELIRAGHPEEIENNKRKFLKLWLKQIGNNPKEALKAWYNLEGGYIHADTALKVADMDGIMDNSYGLYWYPVIGGKAVVKYKELALKMGDYVPIYGMLFSIGAFFWLLVISTIICIIRREPVLCKTLLILLVFTLLIAAPVVDFRYGYALVVTMPMWTIKAKAITPLADTTKILYL